MIDRTLLVLEIFALRAQSHMGKLQVQLARLNFQLSRLVRGWTHLERQKGGIGLRGGPGEKQLESDRRQIRDRIKQIKHNLDKVKSSRHLSQVARKKNQTPVIALIGYTNAGKSTLFNQLTQANTYVEDQLFATLDPLLRKVKINQEFVIISDTVGFIQNLPQQLINAFEATLEEVINADLLLHVVNIHDEEYLTKIEQVNHVLKMIQADHIPTLYALNKIDQFTQQTTLPKLSKPLKYVHTSALHHVGFDALTELIYQSLFAHSQRHCSVQLLPHEAKIRSQIYHHANQIIKEEITPQGAFRLEIKMHEKYLNQLRIINSI